MKKLSLLTFCFAVGCALCALSLRAEDTSAVAQTPEIDRMVYLSFLPEPGDLMADAKRNGLTILRLDRMADRVVVTYRYPDGHTATLGYARFDSAPRTEQLATRRIERMETVEYVPASSLPPPASTTEVVYVEQPYPRTRVVYRDYRDDFWLPLALGLGVGYVTGHNSPGHFNSHWHGGYSRGYHGRGWRR